MIVGIEITPHSLRAVCLNRSQPGHAPKATAEVPYDATDAVPTAADIRQVMAAIGCSDGRVGVAIPAEWCRYRLAAFPYRSLSRIESTLAYTLEDRLPGKISDYIVEPLTHPIPAGASGARVYAAACPIERLRTLLERFHEAGVDPALVLPSPVALAHLPIAANGTGETLLARVEDGAVELSVAHGSEVVGIHRMPAKAAEDTEVFRRVISNARQAMGMTAGSSGARTVLIAGAHAGNASGAAADSLAPELAPFAAAWGVALAAKQDIETVNLRRDPLAYGPHAKRLQRRVSVMLALSAILLIVVGIHIIRALNSAHRGTRAFQLEQAHISTKLTGRHGASLSMMESALATAQNNRKTGTVSCLERWLQLMELVPAGADIDFNTMSFDQRHASITGSVGDQDIIDKMQARAKASPWLKADPRMTTRRAGSRVTFQMELDYR